LRRNRLNGLTSTFAVLAVVASSLVGAASLASASSVTSATFTGGTGTVSVGGTLYAKNGGALTLTVVTSNDTMCVDVTGAFAGHQSSATAKSSWTFTFAAGSGDGAQTATATASANVNGQGKCTGASGSANASYTLDNTGPTVSAAIVPAPNAAGWNKANVAITWSATDAGSGVGSGPSPATDSVNANTVGVVKTSAATDRLGNSGSGSVTVKLDKTPPTISGSATPAANGAGWNNTAVTVAFACSDALSGIKTCPASSVLSSDGANQSVSGNAVDVADNTAGATVSGINIDKTAPTLIGTPTTSANANGWYSGNVGIAWACSDAGSGIAGSCPSASTITGEGSGLTASASVTDRAGNTTQADSAAVRIDRHAPVTTIGAPSAWQNTDVTVTLSASDTLSGVAGTHYTVDGGAQQDGTVVSLTSEGVHTITAWSVDNAGNVESAKTATVSIDKTAPTIVANHDPDANGDGWNNTPVHVSFACVDAVSAVASCLGETTVTTDGKDQTVTGTATDLAGNTASIPTTVSIDTVPPSTDATRSPLANSAGWVNTPVTVSFACFDALSGVKNCPAPAQINEGANQSATGTAIDAAGNTSAAASVTGVNVDITPPTITGAAISSPNADGWYAGDVTIHWTCDDNLSDVPACPADTPVTGETDHGGASAIATDAAGNSGLGSVSGIKIDVTPPTTSDDAPSGWLDHAVTVHLSAVDNLSGVATTQYLVDAATLPVVGTDVTLNGEGTHEITYWSVDVAGNMETPHQVFVQLDLTPPTISHTVTPAPNSNGWSNTTSVVHFTCADALSGVGSCPSDTTVSAETDGTTVLGIASDAAGNTATDSAIVKLDSTKPIITAARTGVANSFGWDNTPVTVTFTCADALSGLSSCSDPQTFGDGTGQAATGTALDHAGNTATTTLSDINVDSVAPTVSGAPTASPNSYGWYNAPVTVVWDCNDDRSGVVDGTCAPANIVDGQGTDLGATSAPVSDRAGNVAYGSVSGISIDIVAPQTGIEAPTGWVNTDVTVKLDPVDGLSGVAETHFTIDGGAPQSGVSFQLGEGNHHVTYWSVDKAGNAEAVNDATVMIDKTSPVISHSQSPTANNAGWNNSPVTVTFICTDALSGIKSCSDPTTTATEGAVVPVVGTAVDIAGNSATDTANLHIDSTPPTITGAPATAPNAKGWWNSNVTVGFTCADALSNIHDCAADQTFTEGASQTATGTATDNAGNTSSATVSDLNVDETPPTVAGEPTVAANASGWYKNDVVVHWNCADALSGVASCPDDSTVTGEGTDLGATSGDAYDIAGNAGSGNIDGIHIDRQAPNTSASGVPSSWVNGAVTVTLSGTDDRSGVAATYYSVDGSAPQIGTAVTVSTDGVHDVAYWSVDLAGNVETTKHDTIRIDTQKPTITASQSPAPNNGWNNDAVTVSFTCADQPGLSGVVACPVPVTVSAEGKAQVISGTVFDNAGNSDSTSITLNIDLTAPTISAAADRAPNGNGWYNATVGVTFTCGDALSGVKHCPSLQNVTEGANQSVTGTAVDTAGNPASATLGPINVDTTPPTLTGAATTAPNGAGWYNQPVTIAWTPSDALSGVDEGTVPGVSLLTAEGGNLSASATVSDNAGNVTNTTVGGLHIDMTPPTTTVDAPTDWSNKAITVTLAASDGLSGIAATYYTVNGGPMTFGTSIAFSLDGVYTLGYWSVDRAGNEESHHEVVVRVDQTSPTIVGQAVPGPNANGWNNTDVAATFTCGDALSLVKSCGPDATITGEGHGLSTTGTAVDNAGNSSSTDVTANIDRTPPTISGAPTSPANGYGWYNHQVDVSFACVDVLSAVHGACGPTTTLASEGPGQSVTGTAEDSAGNTASAVVGGVNIDLTAPTITGVPRTKPNASGWYTGDVVVDWSCADALSLTASCQAPSTISGEGAGLVANGIAVDKAGNTQSASVNVKIDRTDPVTAASAVAPWLNTPATVTFTATDNLSGVATTFSSVDGGAPVPGGSRVVSAEGIHDVAFWSVDVAGNVEHAHHLVVQIDLAAPTIAGTPTTTANVNGWYNHPVTVHFTCTDPKLADGHNGSGVASCSPDQTVATDGANQAATGHATDVAGNTSSATTVKVNVDQTPPSVSVGGLVNPTGTKAWPLGTKPTPTCVAQDTTSGVDTCSVVSVTGGSTNGVGTYTVTARATDKAGNVNAATATYTVVYYVPQGVAFFLQPVNDTGHMQTLNTSIFKAGSTIPLKFQLTSASGSVVQPNTAPVFLTPVRGSATSAALNEGAYSTSSSSGSSFRYDATAQQWIYNWQTPSAGAGYYYRVGVLLDDGTTQFVNIGLR
jgi:hypothetical protein